MGEIMSMHMWSERRKEIRADTKKLVGKIAMQYKSAYKYYLLQQMRKDIEGTTEQKMLLSQRKWQCYNRPLHSGSLYVVGGSDHRKWRLRFCVLQPDYTLEVYDTEEDFHAANKPRFSRKHSSFKVVDNVDGFISQSVKDYLMEFRFMTQDLSSVIKKIGPIADTNKRPTQHVLALSHPYRGTFYMAANTAVEKEKWLSSMQDAARHLAGVHCEDQIDCKAFEFAINKACEAEEHCGVNVVISGTQNEITSDFITNYLASGCKTMLQTKVKGTMVKKYKMWETISKHLSLLVESIVEVEYPPLRAQAEEEARALEPRMMTNMPKIGTSYENITFEIIAAIEPKLMPDLREQILPKIPELVTKMADAMTPSLLHVRDIFVSLAESVQRQVTTTSPTFANNIDRFFLNHLDLTPRDPIAMQNVFQAVIGNNSPFKVLTETFLKVQFAVHEKDLCVLLQKLLDSCIFTFEMLCGDAVRKEGGNLPVINIAKIQGRVLKKLGHDNLLLTKHFLRDVMVVVSSAILRRVINSEAKEKILEFGDLVPVEFSEFLPIENVFRDVVAEKLLEELQPALAAAFKRLANGHFSMMRYQSSSTIDSRISTGSNTSGELSAKNGTSTSPASSSQTSPTSKTPPVPLEAVTASIPHDTVDEEAKEEPATGSSEPLANQSQMKDENGEEVQSNQDDGCVIMDGETGEMFMLEDCSNRMGINMSFGEGASTYQMEEKPPKNDKAAFVEDVATAELVTEKVGETSQEEGSKPENVQNGHMRVEEVGEKIESTISRDDARKIESETGGNEAVIIAESPEVVENEVKYSNMINGDSAHLEITKEDQLIPTVNQNGKVNGMHDSDDDDEPPMPPQRKHRSQTAPPESLEDCSQQDHREELADEDLEKYNGMMEQIIQTGEEKLI